MSRKIDRSKPPARNNSAAANQVTKTSQQIVSTTQTDLYKGPIPSPEDFQKYNEILPGAADRILAMAENEQQIRKEGEAKFFSNDSKRIYAAIILGVALIAVAGIATWKGYAGVAVSLGLAGVISTVFRQLLGWLNPPAKPNQ